MSLGFVNPLLLWGLLAAALPLVIHLLFRRRPRPTPFAVLGTAITPVTAMRLPELSVLT